MLQYTVTDGVNTNKYFKDFTMGCNFVQSHQIIISDGINNQFITNMNGVDNQVFKIDIPMKFESQKNSPPTYYYTTYRVNFNPALAAGEWLNISLNGWEVSKD